MRELAALTGLYRGCAAYVLRNVINGVFYIGSSANLRERLYRHYYQLNKGIHDNSNFQRAYTCWEDIEITYHSTLSESGARDIEQSLLRFHRHDPLMANIGTGAKSTWADGVPESIRQLLVGNRLGRKHSDEAKLKIGLASLGRKRSPESIRKAAEANRGRVVTEDLRDRLREAASLNSVSTPVSIDGRVFRSQLEASRELGIGRGSIQFRLKSDNYPTWKYYEV